MSRYDTTVRCAQIRSLVEESQYLRAMEEIEDMDFGKIPTISDLYLFADVFLKAEKLDVAKELYYIAYRRTASRPALYRLLMLTIRMGDIEEAKELYLAYEIIAGVTLDTYELRYRLAKASGEPRTKLIDILEHLKEDEYTEEWGFQLARLYEQEGMREKCIEECENIMDWFGTGTIVGKAERLREKCMSPGWTRPVEDEIPEPEQPVLEEPVIKRKRVAYAPAQVEEIQTEIAEEKEPEAPARHTVPEIVEEPEQLAQHIVSEKEKEPEPSVRHIVSKKEKEPEPSVRHIVLEKEKEPELSIPDTVTEEEETELSSKDVQPEEPKQGQGFLKRLVNYFKVDLDMFEEEDEISDEDEESAEEVAQPEAKMSDRENIDAVAKSLEDDINLAATITYPVESLEEKLREVEVHREEVLSLEGSQDTPIKTVSDTPVEGVVSTPVKVVPQSTSQTEPEEVTIKSHPLGISALSEDIVEDVSPNGIHYNTLKGAIYKIHQETGMINIALTGGTEGISLAVAKKLFKELKKVNYFEAKTIAKISAEKLATINLEEWAEKFIGGCMYIMEAPSLSNQSVENLCALIQKYQKQIVIILEGSYDEMDSFLNYHKEFEKQITYKVKL